MDQRDLRIRAYLGDPIAMAAIDEYIAIDDLLDDGILPLDPQLEKRARKLVYASMRRARYNVKLLIKRLKRTGYVFANSNYCEPSPANAAALIDEFERQVQVHVPLVYRAWY